jgi:DNA (cytosine-5)-methyltransferase 1
MRYLSVCSGIEAASSAWHDLGWRPLAFSEIEPFPRAVLAHHFPDVPLHGDFTALRDQSWIVDADLLVGGTPCQAFSVAGLRGSLADARGNLTLEFVRLADAIDDLRRAAGRPPAWVVWENVPGVLSVADNAFGAFLGGLVGSDAAIEPPRGRGWTDAGVVRGPKRCAAWRILDAQFFGVAQRRRRVFVLARGGAGDWAPADALLPVAESVRWHSAPRRQAGQRPAPSLAAHTRGGGGLGTDAELDGALIPAVSHCLNAGGMNRQDCETETLIAHTLRAEGFDASEDGTGRGTPLVPVAFHPTQDPISSVDGTTHAMSAGSKGGNATVAVAIPINADALRGDGTARTPSPDAEGRVRLRDPGLGIGRDGDPAGTLNATQPGAVATTTAVRRLTPRECERLQGFPDDWTLIPWRGRPAAECPDGPRYKSLGNSMAVPCMRWIGERIAAVESQRQAG